MAEQNVQIEVTFHIAGQALQLPLYLSYLSYCEPLTPVSEDSVSCNLSVPKAQQFEITLLDSSKCPVKDSAGIVRKRILADRDHYLSYTIM